MRGIDEIETEYYLRIPVVDKVGVMAKISSILQAHEINIEAVIQKEPVSEIVSIIILTHLAKEKNMKLAMQAIEHLEEVAGCINRIRSNRFNLQEKLLVLVENEVYQYTRRMFTTELEQVLSRDWRQTEDYSLPNITNCFC